MYFIPTNMEWILGKIITTNICSTKATKKALTWGMIFKLNLDYRAMEGNHVQALQRSQALGRWLLSKTTENNRCW